MYRILLILLCTLPHAGDTRAEKPSYTLQAEYRYDAVDFEDSADHFLRVKSGLFFSQNSAFNAAVVYRVNERQTPLYTWNIDLQDISPYVSLMAGYYYVHIGAGLFMGQKSSYNFDAFSTKTWRGNANPVTAAKSGNPASAFHGAVLGIGSGREHVAISGMTFYSVNTCYINEDDYYTGSTDAGLESLYGSPVRTHARFEPVLSETYGVLLQLSVSQNLRFSACAAHAGISRPGGGQIGFMERSDADGSFSIRDTTGTSVFAHYTDRVLTSCIEAAMSWKRLNRPAGGAGSVRGAGIIGSVTLSYPWLSLSYTGKYTGPEYYAPFASSAGEERPERAWFMSAEYRPAAYVALGAQLANEKYLAPSTVGVEAGSAARSTCYVHYAHGALQSAKLSFRTLDKEGGYSGGRKRQLSFVTEWKAIEVLEIDTACILQAACGSESYCASAGASLEFLTWCTASVHYGLARASSGNVIYSPALPMPQSSIGVIALREGSHTMAARCAFRPPSFSAYARYLLQLAGGHIRDQRVELYASGRF